MKKAPGQSKRKRDADHEGAQTIQGTKPATRNNLNRSQLSYSATDDPTFSLGYSDNITAACFATNAESTRPNMLTEKERRDKRLLSNRLSARRSRERHKVEVSHLQDQSLQLSQLIETLKNENTTLREYVDKGKTQGTQQQVSGDSRLTLVNLASLLQQPIGSSPMDILLRAQQQRESAQLLQSMASQPQHRPHSHHHPRSSVLSNPLFSTAFAPKTSSTLPINLLARPTIPDSIRHLLNPSTPWDASTTSSTSARSRASKKYASRQSDRSQGMSSTDDDDTSSR